MKACQSGKPAGIGFPSLSDTRSMQYPLSGDRDTMLSDRGEVFVKSFEFKD